MKTGPLFIRMRLNDGATPKCFRDCTKVNILEITNIATG